MNDTCESCHVKFQNSDEVVMTDAMGDVLVHTNCLYDFILGASMQTYYDSYEAYKQDCESDT